MFIKRHVWALCVGIFLSATVVLSAPKHKLNVLSVQPVNVHLDTAANTQWQSPVARHPANNGNSKSGPGRPSFNQLALPKLVVPTLPKLVVPALTKLVVPALSKPVLPTKRLLPSKSTAGGTGTAMGPVAGPDYYSPDYGYYYDAFPTYIDPYYGFNLGRGMGASQNTLLGASRPGSPNPSRSPFNLFPFLFEDPCPSFRYLAPYRQAFTEFPAGCDPRKPNPCPDAAECNPITKSCCIPKTARNSPSAGIALYNAGVIDDLCPRSGGYWGMVDKYYGLDVPVACGKGKPKCDPGSVCNKSRGVCCYNTRLASSLSLNRIKRISKINE